MPSFLFYFFLAFSFFNLCFLFQGLEGMEIEEDKKDLINREIRSFRETHKVSIWLDFEMQQCKKAPLAPRPFTLKLPVSLLPSLKLKESLSSHLEANLLFHSVN
jgi:hypothetical protein